ncbi:hypothetical protein TorRG33x02_273870 [Trema orientale]|uniref:Uncharacterized protein n=1 Tax=Trema orientale TaxID=63057 RepID=A0A2P5CT43_TREOI|nr:hypothetical protein TorRG33x02_273870 [Trema orientale]
MWHADVAPGELTLVGPSRRVILVIDENIELDWHISVVLNPLNHQYLVSCLLLLLAPLLLLGPGHQDLHRLVQLHRERHLRELIPMGHRHPDAAQSALHPAKRRSTWRRSCVQPWNVNVLILIAKLSAVKAVSDLNTHKLSVLVVEEKRGVEPIPVREILPSASQALPYTPHSVDVGVVSVEYWVSTSRVEVAHVLPVGLGLVTCPNVDRAVGDVLQ